MFVMWDEGEVWVHFLPIFPLFPLPLLYHFLFLSGGSRKNIWGAWPLIIWEATTAKRNYYRSNYF